MKLIAPACLLLVFLLAVSCVPSPEECPTREEQAYFESVSVAIDEIASTQSRIEQMLAGTIVDATLRFDADWKRRYASQVATLDAQVANIRRVEAPDSVEDVHQAALELADAIERLKAAEAQSGNNPSVNKWLRQKWAEDVIDAEASVQYWIGVTLIEMDEFCP